MKTRFGACWKTVSLVICPILLTVVVSGQKVSAVSVDVPLHPSSVVGRTSKFQFPGLTELPSNLLPAWNAAAVYPTTICRYAFADDGENFYIIGGVSNGSRVTNVNRYNTGTGLWVPLAPIPAASEAPCGAFLAGKIYVAEGDTGAGFFIYDVATNTWAPGPSVPGATNRYGCAAGALNGKVYIVGGSAAFSNSTQVYDVATNTWSPGTPAPAGFLLPGYTQASGYLHILGGFTAASGVNLNTMNLLNLTTGAWEVGPTFTPARADLAVVHLGNRLYAIGGDFNGGAFFDSTNSVDVLSGGVWASSPDPLPTARQANNAGFNSFAVAGGEIWSTGGITGATFTFLNEHLYRANTPTAAGVSVSGRVLSADGLPLSGAVVTRAGADGILHSTRTNAFGHFTFTDVTAGQVYIFDVSKKGYTFATRTLSVIESIADFDFIGQ